MPHLHNRYIQPQLNQYKSIPIPELSVSDPYFKEKINIELFKNKIADKRFDLRTGDKEWGNSVPRVYDNGDSNFKRPFWALGAPPLPSSPTHRIQAENPRFRPPTRCTSSWILAGHPSLLRVRRRAGLSLPSVQMGRPVLRWVSSLSLFSFSIYSAHGRRWSLLFLVFCAHRSLRDYEFDEEKRK